MFARKITVHYHGEQVAVEIHPLDSDAPFVVYLPGEEGRVILHKDKAEDGKNLWRENDAPTERACELGQLIETSNDE